MKKEKSLLFGIGESEFARQALYEVGGLLKKSKDLKMTLFHAVPDPNISLLSKLTGQDPQEVEKHEALWILEAQKVLEKAKEGLVACGFDPLNIATLLEKKCGEPAGALLKAATDEGIETIAVGRWGKTTVSRRIIGSVTYRLIHLADKPALWIVDPRIRSRDVLVGLVGAPISQRVVDHTVRYFAHLKDSRFTFLHVIPPVPHWYSQGIMDIEGHEEQKKIVEGLKDYTEKVKEIANHAKKKLLKAGISERNLFFKFRPQKIGIARDILLEMEEGNHGILVIGRKGFKDIRDFGLGSKANKLLINGRAFIVCLVS